MSEISEKPKKRPLTLLFPMGESLPLWSFLFSGILTTILGVSCIAMLASAYLLTVDFFGVTFAVAITAFGFSYIHARKDYRLTLITLGGTLLVIGLFLGINLLDVRYGADYFFTTVQRDALRFLPGGTSGYMVENGFAMTLFLSLLTFMPTFLATWVIMRKKHLCLAMLGYLPFVLLSVALNYQVPSEGSCVVVVTCFLMLFIAQNIRKSATEKSYQDMLKIFLPILLLMSIITFFYPQKKYRQDELAQKQYLAMQRLINKIQEYIDPFGTGKQVEMEKLQNVEKKYMGSLVIEDVARHTIHMNVGVENLLMAGNFSPPQWRFMTVVRERNPNSTGIIKDGNRYMYLKTASMARFDGNSWASAASDLMLTDYYPSGEVTDQEALYTVRIRIDFAGEYAFIPYYVDHFTIDPRSPVYVAPPNLTEKETYNMNEKVLLPTPSQEYIYAYNNVPARYKPDWSEEYLAQIYSDCLYVPDATRDAILRSGMLPDWYMDLLAGRETWSPEKTVKNVMHYVASLHPYDADTRFPPDNVDFVSWFMRDSRTGFCVHYASTAVVLLRMVGVPARYVSGYLLTDVTDGQSCEVYTTDAHAWIEYFHPDYGWIMDDPTPGNEEAASYYNFDAIILNYGPETSMVTPMPRQTIDPTPTPAFGNELLHPGEKGEYQEPEKFPGQRALNAAMHNFFRIVIRVLIVLLIVAVLGLLLRTAFQYYWIRKFRTDDRNQSARAYFRYFDTMAHILAAPSSEAGSAIAQKATFSREGITEEELTDLIREEKKNLDTQYEKAKDIRKNLYSIFLIRKKLPI